MNRRDLIRTILGAAGVGAILTTNGDTAMYPGDVASLFARPPAGPAQNLTYRQGVIKSWNPLTLHNTIEVGGTILENLPVLGVAETATYQVDDVVGLMVIESSGGGRTLAIIGQLVTPGTQQALTALSYLSSRIKSASVPTSESTSSTTYTDLATVGPIVPDVLIGPSGAALVIVSATNSFAALDGNQRIGFMSFAVSGATIRAASDPRSGGLELQDIGAAVTVGASYSRLFLEMGLTPGLNTFTAKYRSWVNTVTLAWVERNLTVFAL